MKIVEFTAEGAKVKGYLHEDHEALVAHRVRPALIVCPGGGYTHLSAREADPPALEFFAMGYQVFILSYSLSTPGLQPQRELAAAVSMVRRRSAEWHIDPEKIAVMGFSAGGHLVASLGALWNNPRADLPETSRPNALILCYPVITMGELTHEGSRDVITGGSEELKELLSVENQVTADFPPTFLWHTVDDGCVPVENTMLLARQLQKNHIPFECHLFAHGHHGLANCNVEVESPSPECRRWLELSKTWLNNRFAFVP